MTGNPGTFAWNRFLVVSLRLPSQRSQFSCSISSPFVGFRSLSLYLRRLSDQIDLNFSFANHAHYGERIWKCFCFSCTTHRVIVGGGPCSRSADYLVSIDSYNNFEKGCFILAFCGKHQVCAADAVIGDHSAFACENPRLPPVATIDWCVGSLLRPWL